MSEKMSLLIIAAVLGALFGYFSVKRDSDYVTDSIRNTFNSVYGYCVTVGGIVFNAYKGYGVFAAVLSVCIFFIGRVLGRMICGLLGHAKCSSNYKLAREYFAKYPKIHKELQSLVVIMAELYRMEKNNEIFLKELEHFFDLSSELVSCVERLTDYSLCEHDISTAEQDTDRMVIEIKNVIYGDLLKFSECYPNWQDAYTYAKTYFVETPETVEKIIEKTLKRRAD